MKKEMVAASSSSAVVASMTREREREIEADVWEMMVSLVIGDSQDYLDCTRLLLHEYRLTS